MGEHSPGEEIKRLRANKHKRYILERARVSAGRGGGGYAWQEVAEVRAFGRDKLYWLQTM